MGSLSKEIYFFLHIFVSYHQLFHLSLTSLRFLSLLSLRFSVTRPSLSLTHTAPPLRAHQVCLHENEIIPGSKSTEA